MQGIVYKDDGTNPGNLQYHSMAGESSSSVENNNGKSNGLSSSALAGLSVNETPNPTPTPTPTPIDQGITNTMSSLGKYSMVGESSSSTGNLTSPPVGGGIKYLGTLLPIESLELIPVKNNGQRGRPSLSAFPHPDSTQVYLLSSIRKSLL